MENCLVVTDDKNYDLTLLKNLKKKLNNKLNINCIISLFEDNQNFKNEFSCTTYSLNKLLDDYDYFSNKNNVSFDHNLYKNYSEIELHHNIAITFNHIIGQFELSEVRLDFIRNLTICLKILEENKINNVIFTNIPHNQFTVVLMKVLQIHKIRFLILRETITGNYIIEDSTNKHEIVIKNKNENQAISNFLNYLKTGKNNVNFRKFRDHSITKNKIYNLNFFFSFFIFFINRVSNLIYEQIRNIFKLFFFIFFKKTKIHIYDLLKKKDLNFKDSKTNIFERSNYLFLEDIKKFKYYNEYKKLCVDNINYNEKYIYFPLHYQPEATTVPYGNFYFDQIKALKILSNLSHKFNFKIFVKEHPDTFNMSRTAWTAGTHGRYYSYYENLSKIKNLKILDLKLNSLDLIKNSYCVATITGTSAIESLFFNKYSIIFGDAWYEKMSEGFKKYENFNDLENFFKKIENINQTDSNEFSKFIESLENNSVNLSKSGGYQSYIEEFNNLVGLFEKKI